MKALLLVGIGSFAGGCLRYLFVGWIDRKAVGVFPWSVLLVNIVGSLAIGFLAPWFLKQGWGRDEALPLLLSTGLLGGFTTFSTFSLQTLRLLQSGSVGLAALNAAASVASCLLAVYFGWKLGEAVWT